MGRNDCVFGCDTQSSSTHRFPNHKRHPERYKAWVNIASLYLRRFGYEDFAKKTKRICGRHFKDSDYNRFNRLNILAVPSLNLPISDEDIQSVAIPTSALISKIAPVSDLKTKITKQEDHNYVMKKDSNLSYSSVKPIPSKILNKIYGERNVLNEVSEENNLSYPNVEPISTEIIKEVCGESNLSYPNVETISSEIINEVCGERDLSYPNVEPISSEIINEVCGESNLSYPNVEPISSEIINEVCGESNLSYPNVESISSEIINEVCGESNLSYPNVESSEIINEVCGESNPLIPSFEIISLEIINDGCGGNLSNPSDEDICPEVINNAVYVTTPSVVEDREVSVRKAYSEVSEFLKLKNNKKQDLDYDLCEESNFSSPSPEPNSAIINDDPLKIPDMKLSDINENTEVLLRKKRSNEECQEIKKQKIDLEYDHCEGYSGLGYVNCENSNAESISSDLIKEVHLITSNKRHSNLIIKNAERCLSKTCSKECKWSKQVLINSNLVMQREISKLSQEVFRLKKGLKWMKLRNKRMFRQRSN